MTSGPVEPPSVQRVIDELMAKLAQTQGQPQACEEIIARTRQVVEDFRGRNEMSNVAGSALLAALGPEQ